MNTATRLRTPRIKVADEVWIATALLHRENPRRADFEISEIIERVQREGLCDRLRPGVYQHIAQHCVANRPASPGRYRMLFATGRKTRRLFRPGDWSHASRRGAKTVPAREDIPAAYHPLLDWYEKDYAAAGRAQQDPILGLRGLGKDLWKGEDPDEYVRRLREGWA
ncbi:MAG TPA: hypothetical protein VNN18_07645 [Candidatus Xenobia bacterium]|nr:hypothetical protein [Candidatus Xenobia bacterium]